MTHQHAVETLAIERYLLGEMPDQERDALEEHFFSCAECAEDARAAGALREAVAAGMASRAATRPAGRVLELPAPRRRLASVVIPWALAASLALVAGYQTLVMRTSLTRSAWPMVLSPVTLRPASRGEEPVVFASGGGMITLAVDLDGGATNGDITYEIDQVGDGTIASDHVSAPKDGTPLLLLVPAALLQPGRHYVLVVKNSGNPRLTPADYRFTVGVR